MTPPYVGGNQARLVLNQDQLAAAYTNAIHKRRSELDSAGDGIIGGQSSDSSYESTCLHGL